MKTLREMLLLPVLAFSMSVLLFYCFRLSDDQVLRFYLAAMGLSFFIGGASYCITAWPGILSARKRDS